MEEKSLPPHEDPTTIRRLVCEPIANAPKQELSEDQTLMLIQLLTAGENMNLDEIEKEMDASKGEKIPFEIQATRKRMQVLHSFVLDDPAIIFLATIGQTRGVCAMYLWYVQWWWHNNGRPETISLETVASKIFPYGVPSQSDLNKIWDAQKYSSKNLVDHLDAGRELL